MPTAIFWQLRCEPFAVEVANLANCSLKTVEVLFESTCPQWTPPSMHPPSRSNHHLSRLDRDPGLAGQDHP